MVRAQGCRHTVVLRCHPKIIKLPPRPPRPSPPLPSSPLPAGPFPAHSWSVSYQAQGDEIDRRRHHVDAFEPKLQSQSLEALCTCIVFSLIEV